MKKYIPFLRLFVVLFFVTALSACNQSDNKTSSATSSQSGTAVLEFDKTVHDFGRIVAGERVAYPFKFVNNGDGPLIISGTRSGCGCTVGDYPKDPLQPGQTGKINVVFNSQGRQGFQSESVTVLNNSGESSITLRITAEVLTQ